MEIKLSPEIVEAVGVDALEPFGASADSLRWSRTVSVDLSNHTRARAEMLRKLLTAHAGVRGVSSRIADITRWLEVLDGKGTTRCRRLSDFAPMLKQYLKTAPRHWVYERREHSDMYQPYYVENITYTPPQKRDGVIIPGFVRMSLCWEELGRYHTAYQTFYREDVVDLVPARALMIAGYIIESPELAAAYRANCDRYVAIHKRVGLQFTAVGVGEPDTDRDSHWWRRVSNVQLERDGEPARVVVDILTESDKADEKRGRTPSGHFWDVDGCDYDGDDDDDDKDIKPGDEDDPDEREARTTVSVPLAPSLMCFDLRRHIRLKIYVDQMTEYKYRTDLATKLILPNEVRSLVDMLVSHRGGFRDIVGGKGGGAIILCAGKPGTGKTLTSEVYSEAMQRPLYSVQCSQLGTDPEELEKELLKVFARAVRWNAILLLDECDVYVAARGTDLKQNAIVGVFLRVLEYYGGIMFLTTNRADLVDDAIASRCLARIDYAIPSKNDQERIWRTLADVAGIKLGAAEIQRIVARFPGLSGRDIKNLLKLAVMVTAVDGAAINVQTIEFVRQFKPTSDL